MYLLTLNQNIFILIIASFIGLSFTGRVHNSAKKQKDKETSHHTSIYKKKIVIPPQVST
jgi:hypothetical protein